MRKKVARDLPQPLNQAYNPRVRVLEPQEKGEQVKSLSVFVSLVSLVFTIDGFAQTPAQGPIQLAQGAGGASQGVGAPAAASSVGSTIAAMVAMGVAGVVSVVTSNSTTSVANH
jgi:hypothetical protein